MRSGEAGFTLLEVLIAFVILALSLGVLFRGMAASLRATRVAGQYEEGLSRAQSHLDAISAPGVGISARTEAGEEGSGYRWRVEIWPLATAGAARQHGVAGAAGAAGGGPRSTPRFTLYAASVTEFWSGGAGPGQVTLHTRLMGPPPP